MKICGIICEYNPFHNGHAYLLQKVRKESGCDAIVCIMSGNFTQRGEAAIFDKYTRAIHAVKGGADIVLELPSVFAISPAEIFAFGGVRLLNSIPGFEKLAFGCEIADKQLFVSAAELSLHEEHGFKTILRKHLKSGKSLPRAKLEALSEIGAEKEAELMRKPNNILGVEYQKALLRTQSSAQIFPVRREGADFTDTGIYKNFSSATAIRNAVRSGKFRAAKKNVPPFVADDFDFAANDIIFKKIALFSALTSSTDRLRKITDCSEGLENRIYALAKVNSDFDQFISKATTKRYISSRIQRILTASVLGIESELVQRCLRVPLYLRVLATKKECTDMLLSTLKNADFPLLTRRSDLSKLNKTAAEANEKDVLAADIYSLISGTPPIDERMRIV